VPVAVNQPDIAVSLTPDTNEDQLGFAGTGMEGLFAVDVKNLGYGTPQTSLFINLPAGLVLGPDRVTRDSDGSPI
jgi:hypothetical protein